MEKGDDLKAKGVETIACVAVNDAFVMDAWSKSLGTDGKILMLADGSAVFTKVCMRSAAMLFSQLVFLLQPAHTQSFWHYHILAVPACNFAAFL